MPVPDNDIQHVAIFFSFMHSRQSCRCVSPRLNIKICMAC